MAIQVRRGNEADFDANKMLPGEWAVSLDTKYVRMCFAPGIVLRMASYESFEADMELIQGILEECEEIQTAIERIKSEIDEKASLIIEYSNSASLSATRASEEADRAHEEAERAKEYAESAQSATNVQIATKDRAGIIKGGDNYIAEDGTLTLIATTTETTMQNSCEGRLLFKEIRGKTEQGANPTPTNPQEIRSVEISKIKTHGEQLLNYDVFKTIGTMNGTSVFENNGVTITAINGDAYTYYHVNDLPEELKIPVSEGEEITLSWELDSDAVGRVFIFENGNAQANVNTSANDLKLTHKVRSGTYFVTVRFGVTNAGDTISYKNIMLNKGGEALPYEPYCGSSFTFSEPIELNKIGDVQDVIVDGKVKRRIGMVHVSGDWAWNKHGGAVGNNSYYTFQSFGQANMPDGENGVFTHFSTGILNENHRGFVGVNTVKIRFDEISSIDELKAWLNSNEVYAYFLLDGEVVEDLPIADQIALNSLSTFDGITYLEFDSEVQPTFEGEYGTSKVGGYTLEGMLAGRNGELYGKDYNSRLSALETSVVNNI